MKNQDERWHTNPGLWEKLRSIAREKRAKPTKAERFLWHYLRDGKLQGYKFRRQHSLGQFIVDFYCATAKLVIEVDGPVHEFQKEEDSIRQKYLESHEFRVLRFSNDAIFNNVNEVTDRILLSLTNGH